MEELKPQTDPKLSDKSETSPKPKKRRILTIIGIVVCVIMVPLIIANLILIIKGQTNKDEVPSLFSVSQMYVLTGSMAPTINEGDLIFVKKIDGRDVQVDDIIAFFDPESLDGVMIVHRVKEIATDANGNITFRTMGDANNVYDTFIISADNIVGIYLFRIRGMGRVAMFMQTPAGLIVSVSVPILIFLLGELVFKISDCKKEEPLRTGDARTSEEKDASSQKDLNKPTLAGKAPTGDNAKRTIEAPVLKKAPENDGREWVENSAPASKDSLENKLPALEDKKASANKRIESNERVQAHSTAKKRTKSPHAKAREHAKNPHSKAKITISRYKNTEKFSEK
ncbi:MAG: signal peptidase I [Clostridiales bacterium]|nr:signal peptidase I [Clostridiales bacterium]